MPVSASPKTHSRVATTDGTVPERHRSSADTKRKKPSDQLWLALYFPRLPLEALSRGTPCSDPVAVISDDTARAQVITADHKARAAGVRAGMLFSAACALAPSLVSLKQDREEEAAADEGLAMWSGQFTSMISVESGGILLEVGGSLKLFGGLDALRARIKAGVQALGYTASTGIAPTPSGAWLLARAGIDVPVTSRAMLPGGLAPVPVACMDLPASALEDLGRMGVRSFAECCRLPRDGLARRTSPRLVALLDQALGRRSDPRLPYTPPLLFERCINLAFEISDTPALLAVARILLLELCGFLCARTGGVQDLEVHLAHRRVPATRLSLSLAAPGRDPRQLLTLLEARMARVTLAEPVVYLGVRASKIFSLAPRNHDLYQPPGDGGWDWATLLGHLQARLSPDGVYALGAHPDHRPERAWRRKSARLSDTPPFSKTSRVERERADAENFPGDGLEDISVQRPLWLLEAPRPLKILDGVPQWHGMLVLGKGPERVEGGWWDDAGMARDYYVAANPRNQQCWIYRDLRAPRRWYLHGVFG